MRPSRRSEKRWPEFRATSSATPGYTGIEAGDIFFTQGKGLISVLIRTFSHSPYAHTGVFHEEIRPGLWATAEAFAPHGLRMHRRVPGDVHKVVRLWRNEAEQRAIVQRSAELVAAKPRYGYLEITRIMWWGLRRQRRLLAAATLSWWLADLGFVLPDWPGVMTAVLFVLLLLPVSRRDNPRTMICSNHVGVTVAHARPDLRLTYPPAEVWPGRLDRDVTVCQWHDERAVATRVATLEAEMLAIQARLDDFVELAARQGLRIALVREEES